MEKKRERKRAEITEKGIPVAEVDDDVIWDDLKLRVPFTSKPFISRLRGKARLDMVLSYGLYFNELTKKWTPLTAASIGEALCKARYYPTAPSDLTELSDNPLMMDNKHQLRIYDTLAHVELSFIKTSNDAIQAQTDKLQFDGSNNLKCVYAL